MWLVLGRLNISGNLFERFVCNSFEEVGMGDSKNDTAQSVLNSFILILDDD
jgi:hypothetical protein